MLTLYDYLPSRNAWKVRQLLHHLGTPHRTHAVSIFDGEGRTDAFRAISPTGTVPAIAHDDGRALAESNAILFHLADGTPYLPDDAFARAQVLQWFAFEQERIESQLGALRYWTQTGKLASRPAALVDGKRAAGLRGLAILDAELSRRDFIAGDRYGVADIALFAYTGVADECDGVVLHDFARIRRWLARVRAQPGHLADVHAYAIDPSSSRELPSVVATPPRMLAPPFPPDAPFARTSGA